MPVIMPSEGGYQGPEIEDDTYVLKVNAVTFIPSNGKPNTFGKIVDQLRVKFLLKGVQDEDGEPVFVDPLMTAKLSDGSDGRYAASTYYKMCIALGLEPEQISYGVDTDSLVGLECKGVVVTGDNGWPRVTQYIKLPKAAGKAAVRPQNAPEPSLIAAVEAVNGWWDRTRAAGLDRKAVLALSHERYEREPIDLTEDEREELYAELVTA